MADSTLDSAKDAFSSDGGSGGSGLPFGMSGSSLGLGAGALGLGYLMSQGPGPLPPQFQQLQGMVPDFRAGAAGLRDTSSALARNAQPLRDKANASEAQGQSFIGQGQESLAMAARGQLTPEQKAGLDQTRSSETNQARQMFASMGLNPDQTSSYLASSQQIDANINAMAQKQIQSTIQLGLGQISSGLQMTQQGLGFETAAAGEENLSLSAQTGALGFENAAAQALTTAGQAQLQLDKNYSDSLTSAFTSIGKMFGMAAFA